MFICEIVVLANRVEERRSDRGDGMRKIIAMQTIETGGATIPALGFGMFRMSEEEVERMVPAALEAGLRHFDTAQIYKNEAALGRGFKAAGITRDSLFITTKVWVDQYSPDKFVPSVQRSLEKLGVEQVDLLLLHWPAHEVPVAEQVAMLNAAHEAGHTRHVGVSNYNIAQMHEAAAASNAPIVTNQVEYHPYLDQSGLATAAASLGIALTAYYVMADGRVPKDAVLAEIGRRHGKTAAQVALRWTIQNGVIALSKTAQPDRVAENAGIFDFTLDEKEMASIAALRHPGGRIVNPPALAPTWDG